MEFKAQQIAEYLGGTLEGNPEASVHTFAKIEEGEEGALSFYYDPTFEPYVYQTLSSVILVPDTFQPAQPVKATLVRVADPRASIARLLSLYERQNRVLRSGVHPTAIVAPTASVGKDVYIGPYSVVEDNAVIGDRSQIEAHVFIGADAKVGEECQLYPNATIYHGCIVGNHCVLHSGAVIGADGFGFVPGNTCVDRAMMGQTVIRKGTKIDNLVQIGHNVEVGRNTILCGQVGIAGSSKLGEWCTMTGQVGIAGHITIADHTTAAAQSGIGGNVRKPGQTIMGYPAYDAKKCSKTYIALKSLPELAVQVRQMQQELDALKAQLQDQG